MLFVVLKNTGRYLLIPTSERMPITASAIKPPQQISSAVCPNCDEKKAYNPMPMNATRISQKTPRDVLEIRLSRRIVSIPYILNTP
jgi:hypothetical protein